MGRIRDRVPMLVSAGTLLTGAMLFGAASAQLIDRATTVYASGVVPPPACQGLPCDAEDPDDCGGSCFCNDGVTTCIAEIQNPE